MYLYRGKDIKGRDELKKTCLNIIRRGYHNEIIDVLPHLRILRSPAFQEPLLELLDKGNHDQRVAAAMALGSLGDEQAIDALRNAFEQTGAGPDTLQTAIIEALGELGSERAVTAIVELYRLPTDAFALQRTHLAIGALGQLAQQGVTAAEDELLRLMTDPDEAIRVQAVTELSVAFWHRPTEISDRLLNVILGLATRDTEEVRMAAKASLSNLAQLGSKAAEKHLLNIQEPS